MAETARITEDWRDRILEDPDLVLEDHDLMRALVAANERALGSNVVDLRGIAMERLEARLDRLEDTHRSVIAAAYENLAGTNQIHRAILRLLDPINFEEFLRNLGGDVAQTLRVDSVRLVLESPHAEEDPGLDSMGGILQIVDPGFIEEYVAAGRRLPARAVTLRQVMPEANGIYGEQASWIRSEALMRLDLGAGRLPGMLAFGAEDPHHFRPSQGTDLLAFFSGVFERVMRRWLA
ncbi:DUF484 family protein [Solirhodobacter olei]|uniref:DUF484 family protein n=1 Tax=Solirhodobacter olei TaxID=2493082 RepID=UPI000FD8E19E|nr:DUF484 family protein [Solirhodobacter olei]